jgi:hypothetical protein
MSEHSSVKPRARKTADADCENDDDPPASVPLVRQELVVTTDKTSSEPVTHPSYMKIARESILEELMRPIETFDRATGRAQTVPAIQLIANRLVLNAIQPDGFAAIRTLVSFLKNMPDAISSLEQPSAHEGEDQ